MVEYDSFKNDDSNDVIEFNEPQVIYDLEERSFQFAKKVRLYVKKLPVNTANIEDGRQVIRSSASVGANYIEVNENPGEKDFRMHIEISFIFLKTYLRDKSRRIFAGRNGIKTRSYRIKKNNVFYT